MYISMDNDMYNDMYVYQLMSIFFDGLKFGSKQPLAAALAKTKADIAKKELLLLLVLLVLGIYNFVAVVQQ